MLQTLAHNLLSKTAVIKCETTAKRKRIRCIKKLYILLCILNNKIKVRQLEICATFAKPEINAKITKILADFSYKW